MTQLNTVMKMYKQILDNKITLRIEQTLEEASREFRNGMRLQNCIFTVIQPAEKFIRQKKKKLYSVFIFLEKDFHR